MPAPKLLLGITLLVVILTGAVTFRNLFNHSMAVWGDAPYFSPSTLNSFLAEPQVWTNRDVPLGGLNQFLWLSPLLSLTGLLFRLTGLDSSQLTKLVFISPSLISAITFSYLFARKLKLSQLSSIVCAAFYTLNTYFLLLLDGGQLGVALAYGLFPVSLYFFTQPSFFLSLVGLFALQVADVRVFIISLLTINMLNFNRASIKKLVVLTVLCLGLGAYWLVPLVNLKPSALSTSVSQLHLDSLLTALTTYQPHWPANQFGQITYPAFYFVLFTILIFLPVFGKPTRHTLQLIGLVLLFSFLAKGETPPLGYLYSLFLKLPLATAFRDSSKFYIPLLLVSGVLIGQSISKYSYLLYLFLFLLPLSLYPALLGQTSGLLAYHTRPSFLITADPNPSFSRTLWFPTGSPFSFQSDLHQALDASTLVNLHPIASLNAGTYNRFNFLHANLSLDWLRVLGVDQLVFIPHPRVVHPTVEQLADTQDLLALVATTSGLVNPTSTSDAISYTLPNPRPLFQASSGLYLALGGDEVFATYPPTDYPIVFLESGQVDPRQFLLSSISVRSVQLLPGIDSTDLAASFLQPHFVSPNQTSTTQWAHRSSAEYLNYRYELLTHGLTFTDYDYGRGIAFSTQPGEKLSFSVSSPSGDYYLLVRTTSDGFPQVNLSSQTFTLHPSPALHWQVFGPFALANQATLELTNTSNLTVLNTFALVPAGDWQSSQALAASLQAKFSAPVTRPLITNVSYLNTSATHYSLTVPSSSTWLLFSESFDPRWNLDGAAPIPVYSFANAFPVSHVHGHLTFSGQSAFRLGLDISILTAIATYVYLSYLRPHS